MKPLNEFGMRGNRHPPTTEARLRGTSRTRELWATNARWRIELMTRRMRTLNLRKPMEDKR